jgi:hypothetical protein
VRGMGYTGGRSAYITPPWTPQELEVIALEPFVSRMVRDRLDTDDSGSRGWADSTVCGNASLYPTIEAIVVAVPQESMDLGAQREQSLSPSGGAIGKAVEGAGIGTGAGAGA